MSECGGGCRGAEMPGRWVVGCRVAGVTECRSSSAGSRVLGYRDAGGRGDGAVVRGDYATRCRGLDAGVTGCRSVEVTGCRVPGAGMLCRGEAALR